ncbi:hypothetical protein BKA93DRAFT_534882 [Sparassis latifolia]
MKFLYRASSDVDDQYVERRNIHLQDAQNPSLLHLWNYEKAFMEINRNSDNCFGGGRVHNFLDLGCSPGGFSNWLMKSNRRALGAGITLPDEEARFTMPLELSTFGPRYRVVFDNIITLVMRAVVEDRNPIVQTRDDSGDGDDHALSYDLIIAGAFPTLEERKIPWWLRAQLVLAQVFIIMTNLAPGGSCVMTINTKGFAWLVDVIGLLYQSFDCVTASKSGKLHARRSSCYLVCRGFQATEEELLLYTGRLRKTLKQLDDMSIASRVEGQGVDTRLGVDFGPVRIGNPESLSLVFGESEAHFLEMGLDKIILGLFEPLWIIQYNAIRADFKQILKKVYGAPSDAEQNSSTSEDAAQLGSPSSSPPSPSRWRPRRPSIPVSAFPSQPTSAFSGGSSNKSGSPSTPLNGSSSPYTPPNSPYVPKWRPPQRRMSTAGNRTDNREWRKPAEERLDAAAEPQDNVIAPNLFGRKRGHTVSSSVGSVNSVNSAADASVWWRK